MRENVDFFEKSTVFSGFEKSILEEISGIIERKKYSKDAVILFERQAYSALIFVLEGKIRLSKISEEGSEVNLAILEKSDFWGDTSILDGLPPNVNITAQEDCEIFLLKRDDLLKLLNRKSELSIKLISQLTQKLHSANQKIRSLSLKASESKVASVLMQLINDSGKISNGKIEIQKLPLQKELADMAGTSRETISRTLHSFAKKGLIELHGSNLKITDFEKFKELNH